MTFDGLAERVADARQFAIKVLGDRPGVEVVELITSELAGNAVQHSHTGRPGGRFTLHLAAFGDRWRVRVDDDGGPNEPNLRADIEQDEAGRGLALIAALSSEWGVFGNQYARAVWAEILMPQEEAT
jgi:anti-sigma regulatory factor (Ser/Thr protein kinase)